MVARGEVVLKSDCEGVEGFARFGSGWSKPCCGEIATDFSEYPVVGGPQSRFRLRLCLVNRARARAASRWPAASCRSGSNCAAVAEVYGGHDEPVSPACRRSESASAWVERRL